MELIPFCPGCACKDVVEPNYDLQYLEVTFEGDPKEPEVDYHGPYGESYLETARSVEAWILESIGKIKITPEIEERLSKRFWCIGCETGFDMPSFEPGEDGA